MAFAQYTAKRSLAAGHVASTAYVIALDIAEATPGRIVERRRQVSLAGKVESLYYVGKASWDVTLAPVSLTHASLILEFLESTEDGHTFTFDPYGTVDGPVESMTVVRTDDAYTATRWLQAGANGSTDYVQFAFSVREA